MKNIEKQLAFLIQTQFPSFYNEEGSLFIEFVKAYYKWMESQNQSIYYSRRLMDLRDIDKTVDDFYKHFYNTYLKDVPFNSQADPRILIKRILELYQNKGNERSIRLAIRALFNQESAVYLPGIDLFKLSSGSWIKPTYIEVTISDRNKLYEGKEIEGTVSRARAICENVVRKRVNGKFIDVLYISNLQGSFIKGERIVDSSDTVVDNSSQVLGSLIGLTVINGGQDFAIGDEFLVTSSNGKNGKAIVASISNETGRVSFEIIDGGWGFTTNATVFISDKVLRSANVSNSNTSVDNFELFETVSQNLMSVGFTVAVDGNIFTPNTILFAQGNSTVSNATAGIVSVTLVSNTEGSVRVSNISGNIAAVNNTIKASLVDLVFDTSSNISLFANGVTIESVNATTTANAFVITSTSANTTRGSLLLRPISGNVAATNTSFRLVTNNATVGTVNTYTANLYYTAAVANSADITANGLFIGIEVESNATFYSNTFDSLSSNATLLSYSNTNYVTELYDYYLQRDPDTEGLNYWVGRINTGILSRLSVEQFFANGETRNGPNTFYIGLDSVHNTFYPNSIFSFVRGLTSNTVANIDFVSSGSDASFKVGSLDNDEEVFLTPDTLASNNTGNVPFLNINLDLSPDNANASGGYGFVKLPQANVNTTLLDALRFNNWTIGEISSLTSINPGEGYNLNPIVLVYERDVAGYQRKDLILDIQNASRLFVVGERVEQTSTKNAVTLTVNTFSGTAANGASTTDFIVGEGVYQSNGTANLATGIVYQTSLTAGAGDVVIREVSGSFQLTSTNNYKLKTVSTGANANIQSINTSTVIAASAYGEVKTGSNSSTLFIRRQSFENTFGSGNTVIGITSGASANIVSVYIDKNTLPIGQNSNISSEVQVANAVVKTINVTDSGFGYLDSENVVLEKSNSVFVVTAQTKVNTQGTGEGYYADSGGFLSDDKKLLDSDYYQDFSYEIRSKVPFSRYQEVLKKLVHVAGTKMFGKVIHTSTKEDKALQTELFRDRFVTANIIDSSNSKFTNGEISVFSNGNANSSLLFVSQTALDTAFSNSENIVIVEVPDSNNNFVVNRLVYSPNANSYSISGNLVAKSTNSTSNVTLLYIANSTGIGIFTNSNTISGHLSSNTSNSSTNTVTLSYATDAYGYGIVCSPTISEILVPVSNTLSSSLTGTVNLNSSVVNVVGTSTTFTTNFSNNDYIYFTGGASNDLIQIKTVVNNTLIILRSKPVFSNSASTFKKSFTFKANTFVKMPNVSSNVASANIVNIESNTTYYTYYLNEVSGSFKSSNTVEGYINSTTTNTYTLFSAINTMVTSNTETEVPLNKIITGTSSNTSANVTYATLRIEK